MMALPVFLFAFLPAMIHADDRIGGAVLSLPLSVRQIGMGEVGVGGRDVLRAWSNPATLGGQRRDYETAITGISLFDQEQTAGGIGFGARLGENVVLGGLFGYYSLRAAALDDWGHIAGNSIGQDTVSAGIVSSVKAGNITVGAAVKEIFETLDGDRASAGAVDLGTVISLGDVSAGASVRNLGQKLRNADSTAIAEVLPSEWRAGVSYTYPKWRITTGAEYVVPKKLDSGICAGAEWWPVGLLGLRAGASGLASDDNARISAGFTVSLKLLSLDYAFSTHPLGPANRISLTYVFGDSRSTGFVKKPAVERKSLPSPVVVTATPALKAGQVAAPSESPIPKLPADGGTEKTGMAVSDFTAQNVSAGDAAVITDLLRNELVRTKAFKVVERQNMEKILGEHALQRTGCTDQECAVKLGRLLNVSKMAVGSFGKLLASYIVNVRVIDVESGQIVFSEVVRGKDDDELVRSLGGLADRIAAQVK